MLARCRKWNTPPQVKTRKLASAHISVSVTITCRHRRNYEREISAISGLSIHHHHLSHQGYARSYGMLPAATISFMVGGILGVPFLIAVCNSELADLRRILHGVQIFSDTQPRQCSGHVSKTKVVKRVPQPGTIPLLLL